MSLPRNQRRAGPKQRRTQNILEVEVRSSHAAQVRNRRALLAAFKLLLVAGISSACFFGGRAALKKYLWDNPEYNLAVVEINDDSAGLTREAILSTAGLQLGQNIFTVNLAKACEAITALPQVEHAELHRVLPNKIAIELTERRPVAWLGAGRPTEIATSNKSFLIDNKGVLFKPKRQLPEYDHLPVINGVPTENFLPGETVTAPEVSSALALIQQNSDTNRFDLESVDLSKGYCMIATDSKNAQITFGLENLDRQLERLGALQDYSSKENKTIQTANLLIERNIPVTFAPIETPEPAIAESAAAKTEPKEEKSDEKPAQKTERTAQPEHASEKAKKTAVKAHVKKIDRSRKPLDLKSPASHLTAKKKPHAQPEIQRAEPVIRRAKPAHPSDFMAPSPEATPKDS